MKRFAAQGMKPDQGPSVIELERQPYRLSSWLGAIG